MSRRWIFFTVVLFFIPLVLLMSIWFFTDWSPWWAMIILLSFWLVMGAIIYYQMGTILVDETKVAVIFDRHTNNFAYFIDSKPSGDVAGRPFNLHTATFINKLLFNHRPYHHFINPINERVEDWITKRPLTAQGKAERIRTQEGIPVAIQWTMSFNLDPVRIRPGIEPNLARALPQFSTNMLGGRVVYALRHIVERKNVTELYKADAIKTLETEVREMVTSLSAHLGFLPIVAIDTRLGPIEVPPAVEKAIETDHERQLQTTTAMRALEDLQKVISQFSHEDMERLAELERLRILDTRGGSLFYGVASLVNSTSVSAASHPSVNGGQPSSAPTNI